MFCGGKQISGLAAHSSRIHALAKRAGGGSAIGASSAAKVGSSERSAQASAIEVIPGIGHNVKIQLQTCSTAVESVVARLYDLISAHRHGPVRSIMAEPLQVDNLSIHAV